MLKIIRAFNFLWYVNLILFGVMVYSSTEVCAQSQNNNQKSSTTNEQSPVGFWQSVDVGYEQNVEGVKNFDDFIPGQKKFQGNLYFKELICYENGETSIPILKWVHGSFISDYKDSTYKFQYFVKTMNDSTYLFFPWVPSYNPENNSIPYYVLRKISDQRVKEQLKEKPSRSFQDISIPDSLKKYDDVRWKDLNKFDLSGNVDFIRTFWFNEKTIWPVSSKMPEHGNPQKILAEGMNPGLGIRELHKEGITGKGVNVAIIDYPLYNDHPEFAGKIIEYYDEGCQSESSMHGPAVLSLLAGAKCGTAPDVKVYFAATPDGSTDAAYDAKALDWIVEKNEKLPQSEKIRVVSVSAAPSGKGSPFKENNEMWDDACKRAEANGIMVLDCTSHRGFIRTCYYDPDDPENIGKCTPGFPGREFKTKIGSILVPSSLRSTAEEYVKGNCSYQFCGIGGLSWSIPYCAGVLALGWQLRPEITSQQMKDILFGSAYVDENGNKFINPREFINMVKKYNSKNGI